MIRNELTYNHFRQGKSEEIRQFFGLEECLTQTKEGHKLFLTPQFTTRHAL